VRIAAALTNMPYQTQRPLLLNCLGLLNLESTSADLPLIAAIRFILANHQGNGRATRGCRVEAQAQVLQRQVASSALSSDCDQIPDVKKLTESLKIYKRIVGNRKAGFTLTKEIDVLMSAELGTASGRRLEI
jgi:hypothetical protein